MKAAIRYGPRYAAGTQEPSPGAHCVLPAEFRSVHADDAGSLDHRSAVFLCGAYRFAGDIGRGLVEALPPVLSLPASVDEPIHAVVTLLSREMLHAEPRRPSAGTT